MAHLIEANTENYTTPWDVTPAPAGGLGSGGRNPRGKPGAGLSAVQTTILPLTIGVLTALILGGSGFTLTVNERLGSIESDLTLVKAHLLGVRAS